MGIGEKIEGARICCQCIQYSLSVSGTVCHRDLVTAEYVGCRSLGCARAPTEGRLPSRPPGSGPELCGRADRGFFLDGAVSGCAGATPERRVEALSCRVSGSAGQEVPPAEQEIMLRKNALGAGSRVCKERVRVRGVAGGARPDARRRGPGAGPWWCGVARSIAPVRRWRGSSGICRRSALQSRPCERWRGRRVGTGGDR